MGCRLANTGPAGITNRLTTLHTAAESTHMLMLRGTPVLAAPLTDLLHHGPAAPLWHHIHPGHDGQPVSWHHSL